MDRQRCLRGAILSALLTALLLLPFVNKAFHIDDTLFLRLAEQIRSKPSAPYEMEYNWVYEPESFWKMTQNPPLDGYLLAAAQSLFGQKEWQVRLVYIPLAMLVAVLTYLLAARFCSSPLIVTALSILAPAFLVTASNVQADVLLFFFWLLSVWLTAKAVDLRKPMLLWAVGGTVAAAVMTKYFGVALVPLLLVYVVLRRSKKFAVTGSNDSTLPGSTELTEVLPLPEREGGSKLHMMALVLPVIALVAWSVYSKQMSGGYHPLGAAAYSVQLKDEASVSPITNVAHVLAFFGGTMLWPIFLLPLMVRLPKWLIGLLVAAVAFLVSRDASTLNDPEHFQFWTWADGAMYFAMALAGAMLLAIAALSIVKRPDADSALLGMWLFGTFFFCAFFNWTVSARIVLPCVLPALLLTARWMETLESRPFWCRWLAWSALPAGAISLLVAFSDQDFANAARSYAQNSVRERRERGETVYFTGHWGWQYYLEREEATPFNYRSQLLVPGDVVLFPYNNTGNEPLTIQLKELEDKVQSLPDVDVREYSSRLPFHTMSTKAHAWFYASRREPLPFNFQKQRFVDQFTATKYSPELKGQPQQRLILEHPHLFKNKRVTLRESQ